MAGDSLTGFAGIRSVNDRQSGKASPWIVGVWHPASIALTVGVLGFLVWTIVLFDQSKSLLQAVGAIWSQPVLLVLFVASYSLAFALRALAWRVLLEGGPRPLRLFSFLQISLLVNHLFPTKVGELARIALLKRTGTSLEVATTSTVVARLVDLASLCLIAVAFAPLAGGRADSVLVAIVPALGVVVLASMGLWAVRTGFFHRFEGRIPDRITALVNRIELAMRTVRPRQIALAFALAGPSWLLEAFALWAVAQAAGIPLTLALAAVATAFTIAFQGFQVTPGGLGLYEASLTGVLVFHGIDPGTALALALATHALKFVYSYIAGAICLVAETLVARPPAASTNRTEVAEAVAVRVRSWWPAIVSRADVALVELRQGPIAPATSRGFVVCSIAVGLLFAVVYQLGVPLRATYGARVNVDEPFYLLTTVSLLADGDLDLANDYALRRYRAFFDHANELWYQSAAMPDGRVLSPHNVGLSVLILPGYALAGVDGAKALLGVVGGATVGMSALLAFRATGRRRASLAAAAVLGSVAPLFVYSTQIYPEMPAALLVTTGVWLLMRQRPGIGVAVLLAIVIGALPWFGSKYCLIGGVLGVFALVRLRGTPRLTLIILSVANAVAYCWFHLSTYDGFTPYTVNRLYAGRSTMELVGLHVELWNRLYRLLGLWVDGEFGVLRWAPVLLVVLPVLPLLFRRQGPGRWVWPTLLVVQILVATFFSITMRGWWFPGRMLIVVLPLLVIPLAESLSRAARYPVLAVLAGSLAVYTASITAALVVAGKNAEIVLAVDPFTLEWAPFQGLAGLFPVYTSYTATTWLLTAVWTLVVVGLVASSYIWRGIGITRVRPGLSRFRQRLT